MYLPWKHLVFTKAVRVCVREFRYPNDTPIHIKILTNKLTLLHIAPDTSQSDGSQSQPSHNPLSAPPTISKTK